MSLFSTLNTGATGLGVSGTYLSVVGDNIANINTTGFKQSRASFGDLLPQHIFGAAGRSQLGIGAGLVGVNSLFGQGSIANSDSAMDMAINGDGFFAVSDGSQRYYTRAGEFFVDDQGYVVNGSGLRLQGYGGASGTLTAALGDLKLDDAPIPGSATTTITMDMVLSPDTEAGTDLGTLDFYGTGAGANTLTEAGAAADFTSSVTIYDSLGVGHEVTVLFERTDASTWTWRAVTDATAVYDSSGTAVSSTSGAAYELAQGTLAFDTDGNVSGFTQVDTAGPWSFYGSAQPVLSFDFGMDATGAATDGSVMMNGDESSLTSVSQDGYGTASLTSVEIQSDGSIVGTYSSGESMTMGQVALATFRSTAGLERLGGSLFAESSASGQAALAAAGTGARGELVGQALERSNVELEDQFVAMITAQRSYQANSKVISAADETLQGLLQLL
jgi:flagellar hook protein FlgE